MQQSARPVSAKEIYQTQLYLGENFPEGKPRTFGQISTLAGGQFRVWRGRALYQIRSRLAC